MAVSVSRKKNRLSKKIPANELNFFYSFIVRIFCRWPTAIFLLAFIYIWSSTTTVISGNIVHVCVSSRKLTNLYCLSAGTQPNFQIPVSLANQTASSTDHNVKEAADFHKKIPILAVNEGKAEAEDSNNYKTPILAVIERNAEAAVFDNKTPIVAVNEGKPETSDSDNKTPILAVNADKNETLDYAFRDIEDQLKTHRSWTSDSNHRNTCEGRGIYVYDLPSKFNKDSLSQCSDMIPWVSDFCKYFSNNAFGEPINNLGRSWYHTHQYSLEPIFHARIAKHACRTYNPNEARLFYVPYYGGLDILRWHFKNASDDVKDSLGLELIRWLETHGTTTWYRNLGKDHVFVLGKISWDFRRNGKSSWGTRFLKLDEMQNPAKLLIERQPWHENDIGIPHPTYFHPQTDDDVIQWQLKVVRSKRRNLVSFAGAARPGAPESIRSVLIDQCNGSSNECRFVNCSSLLCDNQPEMITELFLESEFCLQPPGDSPTRRSVFDSLVSGCIPVVFDPMTVYYQYPWHFPEEGDKYSVFVDKEHVRNRSVNVVEKLMKVSVRERENMRRYIVYELLPGLVYGGLDSKFDKFKDAFSISVDNLLERVARLINQV